VELSRGQGAILDGRHKILTVVRPRHHWRRHMGVVGFEAPSPCRIGVDEVETLVGHILQEDRARSGLHVVPSHVRQYGRLKRFHDPRPFAQAFGDDTVFDTLLE